MSEKPKSDGETFQGVAVAIAIYIFGLISGLVVAGVLTINHH